jgi:hypothetical protein
MTKTTNIAYSLILAALLFTATTGCSSSESPGAATADENNASVPPTQAAQTEFTSQPPSPSVSPHNSPEPSLSPEPPILSPETQPAVIPEPDTPDESGSLFTAHFFDRDKIRLIYPLGQLNGGHHEAEALGLSLIWIEPSVIEAGDRLTVYAPADMQLERYSYGHFGSEPPTWTMVFRVNDRIKIRMSAISEAVPRIMDATTNEPAPNTAEHEPSIPVFLEAGEVIGYTTGTSKAHNWDIWVYDSERSNQYANQSRYEANYLGDRMRTAVCPYDFFDEAMGAEYIALLGLDEPGQTTECGNTSRDVPGSLSGQWHFNPDYTTGVEIAQDGSYATPLAIFKNLSNEIVIYQIDGQEFRITTDNTTHSDPAEITDCHCYQLVSRWDQSAAGYAYFELISEDDMKVYYSPSGQCPNNPPTTVGKTYYR